MPAGVIYLISLIQGAIFPMIHNKIFFFEAEQTFLWNRVVGWRPVQNFQTDSKINPLVFEFPYMGAQFGICSVLGFFKVILVFFPPLLETLFNYILNDIIWNVLNRYVYEDRRSIWDIYLNYSSHLPPSSRGNSQNINRKYPLHQRLSRIL